MAELDRGREHFIDALRVIAILMMFVFHVSMVFVAEWDWHIKNAEVSNVLLEINYWMASFRMPLLFFISGYISALLMNITSSKDFVIQRFYRLIIPTVIWTFILVAPQIYLERKLQGAEFSYIEFYKTFLLFEWWPEGNFHWLHLWFIPYLFCYNIISIPIYKWLVSGRSMPKYIVDKFATVAGFGGFVLFAIIPYTFLSVHYPTTYDLVNDYARHSFFIFFVLAGMLCFACEGAIEFIERNRQVLLRGAVISMLTINVIRWNSLEPYGLWENWIHLPQTYVYIVLLNINAWLWVGSFIAYGKRYLNKDTRILRYGSKAAYPFYILHQTVIVVIAYYVVQTSDNAAFKYVFILLVCFLITLLIYHLFIKPYSLMRFLFGAK